VIPASTLEAARALWSDLSAIDDPVTRTWAAHYLFGKDYADICWRLSTLPSTPPPPINFDPEPIDHGTGRSRWRRQS